MRAVAKQEQSLRDDPRPKDRAMWQRVRVLVEEEACHRDWGCCLYRLHRTGRIDNDQREAGDRYATLARDYKKLIAEPIMQVEMVDIPGWSKKADYAMALNRQTGEVKLLSHAIADAFAEDSRELSEFEEKRAIRLTKRYREAKEVAGPAFRALEEMLLDEIWPSGERAHIAIKHALTRLSIFFNTGTKRKR